MLARIGASIPRGRRTVNRVRTEIALGPPFELLAPKANMPIKYNRAS